MINIPYSMDIRWSDLDQLYIVHLVEFGDGAKTHGSTYEEAARMGTEVLEMLIESYIADGQPLPKPNKFADELPEAAPLKKSRARSVGLKKMKLKSFRKSKVKAHVATGN